MRRHARPNAFNRRMTALLILSCFAMVANRAFGLLSNRPVSATVTIDLLLYVVELAAIAITMVRALWLCAILPVAGIVLLHLVPPHHQPWAFLATAMLTLVTATWVVGRARTKSSTDTSSG